MPDDTQSPSASPSSQRLLVVSAHADDETFGCGGTIALETKRGSEVIVCCLTGTAKRHKELQAACDLLGAKVIADKAKDFSLQVGSVTDRLILLIRDVRPEVIITHSAFDYHPDHLVVHKAVKRAAEWAGHATLDRDKAWRLRRLLCMEINNLLPAPTLMVDVSEVIDKKRQAISAYRTQIAKTEGYYLSFNMQKSLLRGLQAGCEFAEAFVEITLPVHGPFYAPSPTVNTIF